MTGLHGDQSGTRAAHSPKELPVHFLSSWQNRESPEQVQGKALAEVANRLHKSANTSKRTLVASKKDTPGRATARVPACL